MDNTKTKTNKERLTSLTEEIELCKATKEYRYGWLSATSRVDGLTEERDRLAQLVRV